jgi:hypothetical protein
MRFVIPSSLLKQALAADALVSGSVAALQIAIPDVLSRLLSLPRGLLMETGVFLVAYALLLVVLSRSTRIVYPLVMIVVLGNLGWAAGCAMLLGTGHLQPSALGLGYMLLQVVAVVAFAALEYLGLRASMPSASTLPART